MDAIETIYGSHDPIAEQNNNWLIKVVIMVNIMLFIIFILPTLILKYVCEKDIPIKHILIENLVIFALIGVVEYLFFTHIASKYIPVKPSTIVHSFIESLKRNI